MTGGVVALITSAPLDATIILEYHKFWSSKYTILTLFLFTFLDRR